MARLDRSPGPPHGAHLTPSEGSGLYGPVAHQVGSNNGPSVELMGRYSKLDIATKLRALLAGSGCDDLPARTTRSVRRLRRLSKAEVSELVSSRQAGEQIDVLAERFGIGRNTVMAHLHRERVPGRRWHGHTLPDDQLAEAGRLYETGLNLIAVAQQFGVDRRYLRQALPGAGFTIRRGGQQKRQ